MTRLFLFNFLIAVVGFAKSQGEFLEQISELNLNTRTPFIYRSGIMATTLSNFRKHASLEIYSHGFKKILISTGEGRQHELFLKADSRPKPLLIFVGGLSSSSAMSAFKAYGLPFADSLRYHIALLENSSSAEWIERNQTVMMSGYEAGWNLYLVIEKLKKLYPVTDIHVAGLSLGGSDVFYVAYFDSLLKTKIVNSGFLAWSSPVARLETLERVRKKRGIPGYMVRGMFSRMIKGAFPVFSSYSEQDVNWILFDGQMSDLFAQLYRPILMDYLGRFPHHFSGSPKKIPVSSLEMMSEFESYLQLYDLSNVIDKVDAPFLWINAEDDPVVDYDVNKAYFRAQEDRSNVGQMTTVQGGHLGYLKSHGQDWINTLTKRYISYWTR